MIELDGSAGEGGGQMVRTALALSALTGKAFRITNIRANRPEPGLKAQHAKAAETAALICNGTVEAGVIGSKELTFYPRKLQGKKLEVDIGTAGSITLLLQSILLPAMFAPKSSAFVLKGGTNVAWSMPIEYLQEILLPQVQKWASVEVKLLKRGYYPAGGGIVEVKVKPQFPIEDDFQKFWNDFREGGEKEPALPINLLAQGHLISIKGVCHASRSLESKKVGERMAEACTKALKHLAVPVDIRIEYHDTLSAGAGCTLWAIFSRNKDDIDMMNPIRIGADCLGEPKLSAEDVGERAAKALVSEINSKAPVDKHLADNLVPFAALACPSVYKASEITEHTRTNIQVVEAFLGKRFEIEGTAVRTVC